MTEKHAVISDDRLYRYVLGRRWQSLEENSAFATFIMLNPSTADDVEDDPTIRRCIGFAKSWGMGGLHVLNLYAYRATKPADLWRAVDPVGPENDAYLLKHLIAARNSGWPLVAAWGANARAERVRQVMNLLPTPPVQHLALTKDGAPRHPLYLKSDLKPTPYRYPGSEPWNKSASA